MKARGERNFDEDPGWDGIEKIIEEHKLPLNLRREWLKEKRDTGKWSNIYENNVHRKNSSAKTKKKTEKAAGNSSGTPKISNFFPSRRDG